MPQSNCQQLREKLESIKKLKEQFDTFLKQTESLENIPELKTQSDSLKSQIGNLRLELFENLESVKTLKKQYFSQVDTLEKLEICSKEEPFITDINGLTYQLPSFKQILAGITFETIKKLAKLKKPQFLLTPIGYELEWLIANVDEYRAKTSEHNLEFFTQLLNEVKLDSKEIYYFPKNFHSTNHNGQKRSEVIKSRRGWLISIVDLEPQKKIEENTEKLEAANNVLAIQNKLREELQQFFQDKLPKFELSPEEEFQLMFKEKLEHGLRGMTYEEYLMLQVEMEKQGHPLDQNSTTILDGMIEEASTNKIMGRLKDGFIKLDNANLMEVKRLNLKLLHRCVLDIII